MHGLSRRRQLGLGVLFALSACAQPFAPDFSAIDDPIEVAPDAGMDAALVFEDASVWPTVDAATREDAGDELPDAAADADADAGEPDAGPSCTAPETLCGTRCVNVLSEAAHCGGCGQACPGTLQCNQGACRAPEGCDFARRNGHGYLFCSAKLSWSAARSECQRYGLDLAIVTDADENAFVKRGEGQWLGLTDKDEAGKFRFVRPGGNTAGAQATFLSWADKEPSNSEACEWLILCTYEDCAEVRADGLWNDAQCEKTTRAYVCESY